MWTRLFTYGCKLTTSKSGDIKLQLDALTLCLVLNFTLGTILKWLSSAIFHYSVYHVCLLKIKLTCSCFLCHSYGIGSHLWLPWWLFIIYIILYWTARFPYCWLFWSWYQESCQWSSNYVCKSNHSYHFLVSLGTEDFINLRWLLCCDVNGTRLVVTFIEACSHGYLLIVSYTLLIFCSLFLICCMSLWNLKDLVLSDTYLCWHQ